MAHSGKLKDASERARAAVAKDKGPLEKGAQKAKAAAEEHGGEVRERVTDTRQRAGKARH